MERKRPSVDDLRKELERYRAAIVKLKDTNKVEVYKTEARNVARKLVRLCEQNRWRRRN